MNPIIIVIPTLTLSQGQDTGRLAVLSSGLDPAMVRVFVSYDANKEGFTRTANKGLREVREGEDVCVLNDDVLKFQFGWLRILQSVLYSSSNFGIAGPSGRSASTPKSGRLGGRGILTINQLPFWCVLVRHDTLKKLPLLDERFIHYSSDTHYCMRARKLGWKCVWAQSVYLWHKHQGSGFQEEWRIHDRNVFVKAGKEIGQVISPAIPRHDK